jgi:hypothetical protein
MMADRINSPVPERYVAPRNNAQGWGVAALIVGLALACVFTAFTIHTRTYRDPTNPMGHSRSANNGTPTEAGPTH